MTLSIARFVVILLTTILAGDALGSLIIFHPSLDCLPLAAFVQAEKTITARYLPIMRWYMPLTFIAYLVTLFLARSSVTGSYWFSVAGTVGVAGMLAITAVELPINAKTLEIAPSVSEGEWMALRTRWERFNTLRTVVEIIGQVVS